MFFLGCLTKTESPGLPFDCLAPNFLSEYSFRFNFTLASLCLIRLSGRLTENCGNRVFICLLNIISAGEMPVDG